MERASEVAKALLKEIIPRFGLPQTLQSDNGPAFISQVTQGVTQVLGIKYHLHLAWRPQSSSRVERANQTIK
jgi:transposase InsO family protein